MAMAASTALPPRANASSPAAEASGQRDLVVLPLTDDPPGGPPPPRLLFEPDPAPAPAPAPTGTEVLPPPRTVLPAEPAQAPASFPPAYELERGPAKGRQSPAP